MPSSPRRSGGSRGSADARADAAPYPPKYSRHRHATSETVIMRSQSGTRRPYPPNKVAAMISDDSDYVLIEGAGADCHAFLDAALKDAQRKLNALEKERDAERQRESAVIACVICALPNFYPRT
ncbi:hypothetical protein BD626DRAFT_572376 [Schizophyllum amplum]|uniref:Uncharacterized protein n=2 Tax=Schizophyllum amplum TaxID=97359 RepID=A0A550C4I5_9AGAR|nr:hypothetical protein BD626DRAFT_572376 [Auriculariopsis ampla]